MPLLLKPFQVIYCIYAGVVFLALMLVIFPVALVASFMGAIRGGNIIYMLCVFWADAWFFLIAISHRNIYEKREARRRQYIFVANHISYLDAPILVKSVRRPVRPLGKIEMAKVPVFGFIYRRAIVTVDRRSANHRAQSVRRLKAVLRSGISILFFPEGTFNTTHLPVKPFYDGAFRIAIETQTPIKPLLFLDAYKRMHYRHLFTLTPGRNRVIHLAEVPVEGLTLADVNDLKHRVHEIMTAKLLHYKASWIQNR